MRNNPTPFSTTAIKALSIGLLTITLGTTTVFADDINPSAEVVLRSDLAFQPLNPARGDAAPQAGVLWGDIKKDVPSGVLLKFADGFSSPPHIHNITYRAVVIDGAVHNDDPDEEKMWMGPGSFWTQPVGESHITAGAEGSGATAFLEILEGPYLVQPADEAFDNGERPVNLDANNVVWLDAADVTWVDQSKNSASENAPKMAFLWGSTETGEKNGTFLKLPSGFDGTLTGNDSWLRAVVIKGNLSHRASGKPKISELEPGSYFGSDHVIGHQISCEVGEDCTLYIRTEGRYAVTSSQAK